LLGTCISDSPDELIDQAREIELLLATDHPSILRLFGLRLPSPKSPKIYLFMDFMANGSLYHLPHSDSLSAWNPRHFESNLWNSFRFRLFSLSPFKTPQYSFE
jgi:serine/threonine protein kinase